MTEQFANNAISALAAAMNSSGTTAVIASVANFPALAAGEQFRITVQDSPLSVPEIMIVTGVSGSSFTVTRGAEGSAASTHVAGAQVAQVLTAALMQAVYPNGSVETAAGPFIFDGSLPVMEINPATPAAVSVTIRTGNLVPFRVYTIADGSGNAETYNITITPDAGLIAGDADYILGEVGSVGSGGAISFYWNGAGIRLV